MIRRQVSLMSLALAGVLALSGCMAGAEPAPAATPPAATPAAAGSTTDTATCAGFNDVATITANADAGLRDGRMAAQEQQGWYRLATRVLDGVSTRGEGEVSDAAAALKGVAPVIALGAVGTTGIGSAEWNSAVQALSDACAAAGAEMAIEMYTGG